MADKSYPTGGEFLLTESNPENIFTPEDFNENQRMFAATVQDFVEKVIVPVREELEYEGNTMLGKDLIKEAGQMGLLMADIPEAYGGMGSDKATIMIISEYIAASGSFAVTHGAQSGIGTLPIVYFGTPEQKQRFAAPVIRGEKIAALAVTEPGAGSDLASLSLRADDKGDACRQRWTSRASRSQTARCRRSAVWACGPATRTTARSASPR